MPDDYPTVAVAVIVQDGRVLLVRRRVPEGGLVWQFPGGKVEPGELVAETAERETREEVGLTVEAENFLGERLHPATWRRISYVACRAVSGAARVASDRELTEVAWCDHAQVASAIPAGVFAPVQNYLNYHLRETS
jgi:8-oxo-dGTP diphosphatase